MVTIVVRNEPLALGKIFYYEPPIITFEGEILPNPKHLANNTIVLSCNNHIPYRVILKKDIISINNTQYNYESTKIDSIKEWQITGSKSNIYTVTSNGNSYSCTCIGFSFHRDCKHIKSIINNK